MLPRAARAWGHIPSVARDVKGGGGFGAAVGVLQYVIRVVHVTGKKEAGGRGRAEREGEAEQESTEHRAQRGYGC